jgi:tRNA pseudouridine38-40 synthase
VRDLQRFEVWRREGHVIACDVTANAFLPHQVRRMVGALVQVGRGKMTVDAYAGLLDAPTSSAGPAAPARGLYLVRVEYAAPLFGDAG